MASVAAGLFTVVVSGYFLMSYWGEFMDFLRGVLPVSFLLAGLIAIIAGVSGLLTKKREKLDLKSKKSNE